MNLAHSQELTRRLLESMLDAAPSLTLVEVEGDALFLYAPIRKAETSGSRRKRLETGRSWSAWT